MKTVVKYCKAEHHFSKTNTFRLGTLQEYREHENELIADPLEGVTPTYKLFNPKDTINLDARTVETLFDGDFQISFNDGFKIPSSLRVMQIEAGAIVNVNSQSLIPNQYIWCTADQESGNRETARSLGYDTWYKITNVNMFMKALSYAMVPHLNFKIPMINASNIAMISGPIKYKSEKHIDSDTGNVNLLMDAVFTKPRNSRLNSNVDYMKNIEYRMLWLMYNKYTKLINEVRKEPIEFEFTAEMKSFCA